jgi:HTH-type transcriptional regulator/antitoxin HigA
VNSSENAIEPNSPEGEEMELLSLLIEKYKQEIHRLEAPSPIEAIKFRMEQMNLKQADVAPLFGGKTRVSEVLNGKRPLTLKMIILLNRYLGIPLESLITGSKKIKLEPEKKREIIRCIVNQRIFKQWTGSYLISCQREYVNLCFVYKRFIFLDNLSQSIFGFFFR